MKPQLLQPELDAYRERGYLHLREYLAPELVCNVLHEAREVFMSQLRARGMLAAGEADERQVEAGMARLFAEDLPVFMNCGKQAQHLVSLHRLGIDERLLNLVRGVGIEWPNISTRPVLYFNSPRLAKSEVYWRVFPHQDWRSMQGSLDAVVIWVPLMDLPMDLGPLEVIPGSHRDGLVTEEVESGFGKVKEDYLRDKSFASLPCSVGDVVLFSSFLVHRSGTNSSPGIRWSCHFRYNNLAEQTFVARGYPHAYIYKPVDDLLTANFPAQHEVRAALKAA